MKFLLLTFTLWFTLGTTNSLSYPIFGTKRYHRGLSPRTEMTQHILKQPVYENGYLTNNGYYYYPHHEYQSYGMPTYRGEYKPKTYYYSAGPSYNYYNDRESVSNPLDDLHEEILQENEQERQSDLLGQVEDYDDDYYIEPNEKIHDAETSNFLRNMMEYNRQKEKLQRLQQLQYEQHQRELLNERTQEADEHLADKDYFAEMEVNPDDYQFEPKGEDNFDLQKYWDSEMSPLSGGTRTATNSHYPQRETFNESVNDKDVEELKSLTKHESDNSDDDYKKRYNGKMKGIKSSQQLSQDSSPPLHNDQDDDYSPIDYDDGSWINWDRKRSSLPEMKRSSSNKQLMSDLISRKQILVASKKRQENSNSRISQLTSTVSPASYKAVFGLKEKYSSNNNEPTTQPQGGRESVNYFNKVKRNRKNSKELEKSIYKTIKQMIIKDQELNKNVSKMQKRNIPDDANVVNQLNSLRRVGN